VIDRRAFLEGSLALAAAGALPACAGDDPPDPTPLPERPPIRIPPEWSGGAIVAETQTLEMKPDVPSVIWTLGGGAPAPTIRVRRGDAFSARLENRLADHTNIHWHGLTVPADMDGHPRDVAHPGDARMYTFPVLDRAGTYWYHPHAHQATAKQIYHGMAGFFLVEDDESLALPLPRGELDVPLLIQDKRFHEGEIEYAPVDADIAGGYLGDTAFVNGVPDPKLEVEQNVVRLRILNGSNARAFLLSITDGRSMFLIGTDGGLIDAPIPVTTLWVAPAERVEVLVDFSGDRLGTAVSLASRAFTVGSGGHQHGGSGGIIPGFVPQGGAFELLRFEIARPASVPLMVPASLVALPPIDPSVAVRTRPFVLEHRPMATVGRHTINGLVFDMERIDEEVPFGETEIWRIQSTDKAAIHPIHVHGGRFRVVSRTTAALPTDRGYKDTVLVFPEETVEILVRFDAYRGLYLFHCHTLEHEDDGMMLNINVS
jgi:FtsP/CotA-like multicopper oxidase with cupredoxin domain